MQTKNATTEGRVLPGVAGLYPKLRTGTWYKVHPDGVDDDGYCWLCAYGVKERVLSHHFQFRTRISASS